MPGVTLETDQRSQCAWYLRQVQQISVHFPGRPDDNLHIKPPSQLLAPHEDVCSGKVLLHKGREMVSYHGSTDEDLEKRRGSGEEGVPENEEVGQGVLSFEEEEEPPVTACKCQGVTCRAQVAVDGGQEQSNNLGREF